MPSYLITSALPYINGIKHLGNLVGSLLPADVYARHLRQQGEKVLYICGTDEHGTPAELAANAAGESVETYCRNMYETQKKIYQDFGIQFDYFGRSSSPTNHTITQAIFDALDINGFIETRRIKQVYSNADQRFLPDRYVEGTCPHCQYTRARGDQCEQCGRLLDTTDLIEPRSAISGSRDLEIRESEHVFLKLSDLSDRIAAWVEQHEDWPAVTKGIAHKWLMEGLQPRCISRDLKWGVPIPKQGLENKVFYVWFDAPMGYISMTQEWAAQRNTPEAWQAWWQPNQTEDVYYVQFMAKDNVPFHAIFWPAMLMGAASPWKLVDFIKGFNWLTYAGGKFSTSQQRGVFSDVALSLFPADYWRYYLMANAPESTDSDFTFPHFAACINKDLADVLGNFVNRVTAIVTKHFDNAIPDYEKNNPDAVTLVEKCKLLLEKIDVDMRACRFRMVMQALRELWCLGNEYIAEAAPWQVVKTDKARAATILVNGLHLMRLYAIASNAVIPFSAQIIFKWLGEPGAPETISFQQAVQFDVLPVGRLLCREGNLFSKITDEQVAELVEKFAGENSQ